MKKYIYLFVAVCLAVLQSCAGGDGKQKLSVLYVGGSAEIQTLGGYEVDSTELAKSVAERMASFKEFLEARFSNVKVMDAKEYTAAMSDGYDVTIFDGKPTPIRPKIHERDAQGRTIRYEREAYLPDDFDRAVLCIADASEDMGRSIGTKNDWFCLCLNAHALGWKKDHPIFQGPFEVNIQTEMRPTPKSAFEYAKMTGEDLPAETEMWMVQNTSYEKTPTYRIGMVSRPNGYLDSPETEVISGGECAKSIDAVAIGRHANFFHWGFSASPAYLTEAGKAVLANAIVYAARFNGQHVVARKLNENIATRHMVMNRKYVATRECWQDQIRTEHEFYQLIDSVKQAGLAKRAKGEELTATEKMYVDMDIPQGKDPSYAEHLQNYYPQLYPQFGEDVSKYVQYYEENTPYFHPDESGYNLVVDEDIKSLGMANNDLKLIDTCIALLEKGENAELATRVLHRYTLCRFATPVEWRKWFDTYKDKMFFTESGGWLWLIDTQDRTIPGNDYNVLKAPANEPAELPALEFETDNQNPVALGISVTAAADGSKELVVRMKIHNGFHTYAQVSGEDPFLPTKVEFELPEGFKPEGKLMTPAFKPAAQGSKTTVYEGEGVFRQRISGTGKGEVKCTVAYQCCDASICFPPAEKVLTVTIP